VRVEFSSAGLTSDFLTGLKLQKTKSRVVCIMGDSPYGAVLRLRKGNIPVRLGMTEHNICLYRLPQKVGDKPYEIWGMDKHTQCTAAGETSAMVDGGGLLDFLKTEFRDRFISTVSVRASLLPAFTSAPDPVSVRQRAPPRAEFVSLRGYGPARLMRGTDKETGFDYLRIEPTGACHCLLSLSLYTLISGAGQSRTRAREVVFNRSRRVRALAEDRMVSVVVSNANIKREKRHPKKEKEYVIGDLPPNPERPMSEEEKDKANLIVFECADKGNAGLWAAWIAQRGRETSKAEGDSPQSPVASRIPFLDFTAFPMLRSQPDDIVAPIEVDEPSVRVYVKIQPDNKTRFEGARLGLCVTEKDYEQFRLASLKVKLAHLTGVSCSRQLLVHRSENVTYNDIVSLVKAIPARKGRAFVEMFLAHDNLYEVESSAEAEAEAESDAAFITSLSLKRGERERERLASAGGNMGMTSESSAMAGGLGNASMECKQPLSIPDMGQEKVREILSDRQCDLRYKLSQVNSDIRELRSDLKARESMTPEEEAYVVGLQLESEKRKDEMSSLRNQAVSVDEELEQLKAEAKRRGISDEKVLRRVAKVKRRQERAKAKQNS
ncbi:hypothetical protein KIPB_002890, partial [Kipferlia bialata]